VLAFGGSATDQLGPRVAALLLAEAETMAVMPTEGQINCRHQSKQQDMLGILLPVAQW
jgi:hypothetical protein